MACYSAKFNKMSIPMVRKIYPKLISNDIVGVQPLGQSASLIFYLRYRYAKTMLFLEKGFYTYVDTIKIGQNRILIVREITEEPDQEFVHIQHSPKMLERAMKEDFKDGGKISHDHEVEVIIEFENGDAATGSQFTSSAVFDDINKVIEFDRKNMAAICINDIES